VSRHGGTLEAGNRPDGGACFELWLPAAPHEPGEL
jgi:signal transduction histidine kinase